MSELHDAVQDELAAHRPDGVPPFAAVRARKRSRDRRRLATGGAAVSVVAVGVLAVLAPSLAGGGADRLPAYAGGTATTTISVTFADHRMPYPGDADVRAVQGCVGDLGRADHASEPVIGSGQVVTATVSASPERREAVIDCLRGLEFVTSVQTQKATVEPPSVVMPVPVDPPGATVCPDSAAVGGCRPLGAEQARDVAGALARATRHEPADARCQALPVTYVVTFGSPHGVAKPVPYRVPARCAPVERAGSLYELDSDARDVVVGLYESAGVPSPASAAPALPPDPAGAEFCKDGGDGGGCYDLGRDQARRLADALAHGRPAPDRHCLAAPVSVYRVTWLPVSASADPVVWTVPSTACLPMTAAGTTYDLDQDFREVVASIWDGAGLYAVDETTTGRRPPSEPRR